MNTTYVYTTLTHISCYSCGIVFGIESGHNNRLRENHENFYCPNGHIQHYTGKTKAEERAEVAERNAEWCRQRAESAQREATIQTHRARGLKAAKTRLQNRIKKGVCPACNRYFDKLHRHMAGQHAGYGESVSTLSELRSNDSPTNNPNQG